MNDGYLTIPEIAKETSIPASTVRRYLEQHNHTLRTKKGSRGAWLLKEEDIPLMREIRACYEQKMSTEEVEEYLLKSGQPITVTVDDEDEQQVITPANAFMQLASEVQRLQNEVSTTNDQLASAHEEIRQLKEQQAASAEKQQQSMDELSSDMKMISEGVGRLERERQKRAEQSFWQRLFGR
jgi:DNA-binding transcriptional MerR regulator